MATLDPPDGYRITRSSIGYAAHSPYGPLGDDFECEAAAIYAALDHADALAADADEDDDLPATAKLLRAA